MQPNSWPTSGRQNKNAHRNDRYDKRDRDDVKKPVKTGKGAFIMPTPKKEDAKVEEVKTITLPETLTIRELAEKMKMTEDEIKDIMKLALDALTVSGEGNVAGGEQE